MAYFTPTEFRTRFDDLTADDYSDEQIDAVRATAEQAFEDAAGVAFEPRTATESAERFSDYQLRLGHPLLRSVTGVLDRDGDTVDLADVNTAGVWLTVAAGWPSGALTVTYQHGYTEPPLRVKQAVMLLTRVWLVEGPVSARATQMSTDAGGTINLATPGTFGATFGVPEVDATLQDYRRKTYIG